MSLLIFNRSLSRANVLLLINQGKLLTSKSHVTAVNTLQPKLPVLSALSWQQMNAVPFSRSTVAYSETDKGHSHVRLWQLERVIATGMLGLIPAAFIFPHPAMDYLLSLALVTHVHWGLEAIFVDYIRPAIFGKTIPKLSIAALYFFSAFALGGLFYFNYSDVGLVKAMKMFWAL